MKLTTITDDSWMRHVEGFKSVETFALDDYIFELYVIDEIGFPINYLYRLLGFKEGIESPVLSINTEFGPAYIYFHTAIVGSKHINLGLSTQTETLEQFRTWALGQLPELLPNISKMNVVHIQKKGLQLHALNELSEFELKRIQKSMSQLVELSHDFLFPFYLDEPKDLIETHTVTILKVKLLLMETKQGRYIGAVLFPKKEFTEEEIPKWLFCYGMYYVRYTGGPIYVDQCENVLFSYLADGYVLVVYLKGKDRKQVQHIYDTTLKEEVCDEVFFGDLDLRMDKSIFINDKQVRKDQTIELVGDLNIVYLNGMTMYADQIVIKNYDLSFVLRKQNLVVARVKQFSEMYIEVSEVEFNNEKNIQKQCCYIEYKRTI